MSAKMKEKNKLPKYRHVYKKNQCLIDFLPEVHILPRFPTTPFPQVFAKAAAAAAHWNVAEGADMTDS